MFGQKVGQRGEEATSGAAAVFDGDHGGSQVAPRSAGALKEKLRVTSIPSDTVRSTAEAWAALLPLIPRLMAGLWDILILLSAGMAAMFTRSKGGSL